MIGDRDGAVGKGKERRRPAGRFRRTTVARIQCGQTPPVLRPPPEEPLSCKLRKSAEMSTEDSVWAVVSRPPTSSSRTAGSHPLNWNDDPPTANTAIARRIRDRTVRFNIPIAPAGRPKVSPIHVPCRTRRPRRRISTEPREPVPWRRGRPHRCTYRCYLPIGPLRGRV